jgi:hypothetical protein
MLSERSLESNEAALSGRTSTVTVLASFVLLFANLAAPSDSPLVTDSAHSF